MLKVKFYLDFLIKLKFCIQRLYPVISCLEGDKVLFYSYKFSSFYVSDTEGEGGAAFSTGIPISFELAWYLPTWRIDAPYHPVVLTASTTKHFMPYEKYHSYSGTADAVTLLTSSSTNIILRCLDYFQLK